MLEHCCGTEIGGLDIGARSLGNRGHGEGLWFVYDNMDDQYFGLQGSRYGKYSH
jgi:hypothetical protein